MYKLTKDHVGYLNRNAVPLLIRDGVSGPYDRNTVLPFTNDSTAFAFVSRHLLGETLPGDPGLSADAGANLEAYCWEYLTEHIPAKMFEFAEFFHRLKMRGIKIPELIAR